MSAECEDFIQSLLQKNPTSRLGRKGGANEILNHPWLSNINMSKILKKEIKAPYQPEKPATAADVTAFNAKFLNEEVVLTFKEIQMT